MGKYSQRFSDFIVRNRWWVIGGWVIVAAVILVFAPKLSSVQSNDQSSFLPAEYESAQAQNIAKKAFPENAAATSTIIFKHSGGTPLAEGDIAKITAIVQQLNQARLPKVTAVVNDPTRGSPDGKLQLAQVIYTGDPQDEDVIGSTQNLRDKLASLTKDTGLSAKVTGEVATGYDTQDTFDKALQIVGIGTIILILILPALVFRSPFLGLLPVGVVALVYEIASSLLALTAHIFNFKVNQQLTILITVVAYGVGTDYILFLLFRYRERLRSGDHTKAAIGFALSRAGEAILSAALVVASSFTALFFAKFGILSSFAPGLVILIGVMLLAALTLVPALVSVLEQKIFWPSKSWKSERTKPSVSKRLGGQVAKRPAIVAGIIVLLLLFLSVGALGYKADFTTFSQPPKDTESGSAFEDIQGSFPAGVLYPTTVYIADSAKALNKDAVGGFAASLQSVKGVAAVLPPTLSADGHYAALSVVLKDDPYSSTAFETVAGPLHDAVHGYNINGAQTYIGGITATFRDVEQVTNRDLAVIFPIAAAFIFVILALLLRSLIAPLSLVIIVSLGFAATLGANIFLFTGIGSAPGLIFIIPILLYVFVVAIGTDYNILTVTRLREEVVQGNAPRRAADLTIEHSSATVASAGLILAGSFASLLFAGVSFLTQMGAAIAIGVILSAFIIAPILVPSVAAKIGNKLWWPGHRPGKSGGKS